MTIGIVAWGPRAGQAVFTALKAVERAASGSIGGFAAFAAIDSDGNLHERSTQRGGSATLFTDGESTGVSPDETVASAVLAGVISSGPDRPLPLRQFLAADPAVGLVSGHRLPNALRSDGVAFNEAALAAMRAGQPPKAAVDAVLDAHPEGDVGLIAGNLAGQVYARNSERVARRPDLGEAQRQDVAGGATVAVLHNAIRPGPSIAALAAEIALAEMTASPSVDDWVVVEAGATVALGAKATVELDENGRVLRVLTMDPTILQGRCNGAAIYLGAEIRRGESLLGYSVTEPNVELQDGRILSMSGQTRLRLHYRRV